VFVFHCQATDLFDVGGLTLKVKDYDRFGKNDDLGSVLVPAKQLYTQSNGDDMEFKLAPPKGRESEDAGYITIRSRITTAGDHSGEKKGFLGDMMHDIKAPISKIKAPTLSVPLFNKRGSDASDEEEPKPLFIQIVSCKDLIAADKNGASDPYVKVRQ